MAIKGSTKIELTNVHTGQKEVVEHHNHQIFEADGITRMAIGEHNNNYSWQCYVNL